MQRAQTLRFRPSQGPAQSHVHPRAPAPWARRPRVVGHAQTGHRHTAVEAPRGTQTMPSPACPCPSFPSSPWRPRRSPDEPSLNVFEPMTGHGSSSQSKHRLPAGCLQASHRPSSGCPQGPGRRALYGGSRRGDTNYSSSASSSSLSSASMNSERISLESMTLDRGHPQMSHTAA